MRTYLLGLLLGASASVAALYGGYLGAKALFPHHVPAPAITSLAHLDEKLRFIRHRPGLDPTVLAVGSSITWRQLDGAPFATLAGGPDRVFNGATGFLKAHQTEALTQLWLELFPNVRTVVQVTALPDVRWCKTEPALLYEPEDAAGYASGAYPEFPLYLRYFAPYRYYKTAWDFPEQMVLGSGDYALDRFGSGPIDVDYDRGLFYERIDVDRDCAAHTVALGRALAGRGIRFVVAFAPVHPGYWEKYPDMREETQALVRLLRDGLRPYGGQVVDMHADPGYGAGDFYDAFHFKWSAARRFSVELAEIVAATEVEQAAEHAAMGR